MALIKMVLRKMIKNKWLIFSLLIGLIISVSLISSISIYRNGILQRLLIRDLEDYQLENNEYPGSYLLAARLEDRERFEKIWARLEERREAQFDHPKIKEFYQDQIEDFNRFDDYLRNEIKSKHELSTLSTEIRYSTRRRKMYYDHETGTEYLGYGQVEAVTDFMDQINLVSGRLPKDQSIDGVYETLITQETLEELEIKLGETILLEDPVYDDFPEVFVKPVGVFEAKDSQDPYWLYFKQRYFDDSFLISEELFKNDFVKTTPSLLQDVKAHYSFDYYGLEIDELTNFKERQHQIERDLNNITDRFQVDSPLFTIINSYIAKAKQLTTMMWSLNVPVIIMLFLYLFMVSKLIISQDENEIALLSSRGATRFQIVCVYVIEGVILIGIAFLIGPWIGGVISKFLGASSGFLEFVRREPLSVKINFTSYLYSGLAALFSFVTMLIPAYLASRYNIVEQKKEGIRTQKEILWKKYYLDILLLIISFYGYYLFMRRQEILKVTDSAASEIAVNPLLFFMPAVFILGVGLLALRVYPLIVKGIYRLGYKFWPTSLYSALTKIARTAERYYFLMIFIILTLAIGVFSSSAARTLNQNEEERVLYQISADLVVETEWEDDVIKGPGGGMLNKDWGDPINYREPSFAQFKKLSGVEHATKVFKKDHARLSIGSLKIDDLFLMGIEPYDFGKTAWFWSDLLKYHLHDYLNLLNSDVRAALISNSLSERKGIGVGDKVEINWEQNNKYRHEEEEFIVYETIDYWPNWNPNENENFVVANLDYIQNNIALEPYELWLDVEDNATNEEVYQEFREQGIDLTSLKNQSEEIEKVRNKPHQLVINGMMTFGFLITGVITFIGFLLYWILSFKGRILQLGVFRAMGLSKFKVILMMFWEQILTSGAAIIIGIGIGIITSRLFVPLFQIARDLENQVPPFRIIFSFQDRLKIYSLTGIMIVVALTILGYLLAKLKISGTIKLGED